MERTGHGKGDSQTLGHGNDSSHAPNAGLSKAFASGSTSAGGPLEVLLREVGAFPEVRSLTHGLGPGSAQAVQGLGGSAKTLVVASVHRARALPTLYICGDLDAARRAETELVTWLGEADVLLFPPREPSPVGTVARSGEIEAQRLRVLDALLRGGSPAVVAPIEAAATLCPPVHNLRRKSLTLRRGDRLEPQGLASLLVDAGYQRVPVVEKTGDFAVRGGIVDVFPPARDKPYRLEFEDGAIASLRSFAPDTQRSSESVGEVCLGPAREWLLGKEDAEEVVRTVRRELNATVKTLEAQARPDAARRLEARVLGDLERMEAGTLAEDAEAYAVYVPDPGLLVDYLPSGAAVFFDEPVRLEQVWEALTRSRAERLAVLLGEGGLLPGQASSGPGPAEMRRRVAQRHASVFLSQLLRRGPQVELTNIVSLRYQAIPSFHGKWSDFEAELARWRRGGDRVVVLAGSPEAEAALGRSLREVGVGTSSVLSSPAVPGQVVLTRGVIEEGFYLPWARLRVVTDAQIRGRAPKRRRRPGVPGAAGRVLDTYRELEVGDHVVHVNHGIGVYQGIRTLEINGVARDYILIQYAGEDRLYVPTDQVGAIHKYVGVEGQEPKVNRLAGSEWARLKNRTRKSLQKLAVDLLKLHAQRQALPGHAFSPDTPWQAEFEAGFRYEETPDQLAATEEIKRDMERPIPMDRVLCGDVGYGKTEVAMRAAFKAVMDGKQVAVLVPTTVLAQQHYNTFRERFAGYPVNIDLLSRFRSKARQEKTIRDLRRGTVDIVIGTHRLLTPDVVFKDLGLLIIDEEHRFGVNHKERLKELRATVDVLVLTATPIPRTLNMALVGLRDMSVIQTPPEDRYPVQTYVVEYDEDLVRDAVLRELGRGGQVFYVHNRVQTIEAAAARLQALVPKARITVAHGQMREEELERTMLEFLEGEYDVLVSTTIIESGLDMPNVNTLIVEDADTLGLAQLYQLRGRVGRSSRVAYAYFTYRRVPTEQAERRLEAIREFTELGSGYKIALRDLEIRGAGNLLGPEQHGFIASVGFELYCRMLEEAIRELTGRRTSALGETTVDVRVDAYLPDHYIPDMPEKIEAYHRLASVLDPAEVDEVEAEIVDRYGPPPPPAANLLLVARVKAIARSLGCSSIVRTDDGGLAVKFEDPRPTVRAALESLGGRYPGVSLRGGGAGLLLTYRPGRRHHVGARGTADARENVELLRALADLLGMLAGRVTYSEGKERMRQDVQSTAESPGES